MGNFIGEDELSTFDGWMKYQAFDPSTMRPEELEDWRSIYDEGRGRVSASPKAGLMKRRPLPPGEYRYAVAVREGVDLWLVLWIRRSAKGEFFVFLPRGDRAPNIHASYHLDGTLHLKCEDRKDLSARKCQPLTGTFRGNQPLATFSGYGPKSVGAICDPAAYSGIVEIPSGILGPRNGQITVDLVEPGCPPANVPWITIHTQETFRDFIPWVVVTIGSCD
jgi:hypothetical protein